jgi:signal transduction histidine kinase
MTRRALPRLRTLLLVFGLFAVVQLGFAIAAFLQATQDSERGFVFPGPDRVRSIVLVIDQASASLREEFARALSNEQLTVAIVADASVSKHTDEAAPMPGVESVLETYIQSLGDRQVMAWISPGDDGRITPPRLGPGRLWSRYPLKMAVELERGDWLVIETRGNLAQGFFGFPPGFWAGIFGVTVAFGSLWLLWRSLSPLSGLAAALARFSADPVAVEVRVRGPEETRRIIEAVNRMQVEIAGFIAERQVMFGALSHDLRTILTRLALRIGSLADAESRERAERDLFAMSAILEDALVLARLDAQPARNPSEVALGELVHELEAAYPDNEIRVQFSGNSMGDDIRIHCDGTELFRALQNLVENAIAYAGSFEMAIYREGNRWRFDILDRGPGIAEADRGRLIRPFVRGDGVRSMDKQGAGLGLAIAAKIAQRSGGALILLDRAGGGLIARLEIPGFDTSR